MVTILKSRERSSRTRLAPPRTQVNRMSISFRPSAIPASAWRATFLVLIALAGCSLALLADRGQTTADTPKTPQTEFECRWADTPITIDGKADEAAWKRAQVIDN